MAFFRYVRFRPIHHSKARRPLCFQSAKSLFVKAAYTVQPSIPVGLLLHPPTTTQPTKHDAVPRFAGQRKPIGTTRKNNYKGDDRAWVRYSENHFWEHVSRYSTNLKTVIITERMEKADHHRPLHQTKAFVHRFKALRLLSKNGQIHDNVIGMHIEKYYYKHGRYKDYQSI